jgi:hypothetical protein
MNARQEVVYCGDLGGSQYDWDPSQYDLHVPLDVDEGRWLREFDREWKARQAGHPPQPLRVPFQWGVLHRKALRVHGDFTWVFEFLPQTSMGERLAGWWDEELLPIGHLRWPRGCSRFRVEVTEAEARRIAGRCGETLLPGRRQDEGRPPPDHTGGRKLTHVQILILQTLKKARRCLTRDGVVRAMRDASHRANEGTIYHYLTLLRTWGLVENQQQIKPVGFRITRKGLDALKQATKRRK